MSKHSGRLYSEEQFEASAFKEDAASLNDENICPNSRRRGFPSRASTNQDVTLPNLSRVRRSLEYSQEKKQGNCCNALHAGETISGERQSPSECWKRPNVQNHVLVQRNLKNAKDPSCRQGDEQLNAPSAVGAIPGEEDAENITPLINDRRGRSGKCWSSERCRRFSRRPQSRRGDCQSGRSPASANHRSRKHRSTSMDSAEEYRRSRSRERKRRRAQYLTMQKNNRGPGETSQVFWDGFQWVKRGDGSQAYNQEMNSTRKARRLHIGNLPLSTEVTEKDFKGHLWAAMIANRMCSDTAVCPILHVWFARDRGGTFGFVEMASVEAAHAAMTLDGLPWKGSSIRINRPTDWKCSSSDKAAELLASASGFNLAVAESLAAAAQQAKTTGNVGGLIKLVSSLPVEEQKAITQVMSCQNSAVQEQNRSVEFMKEKIRAELLNGPPSRVVRVKRPSSRVSTAEDCREVLDQMKEECGKEGTIVSALVVTPDKKDFMPDGVDVGDVFIEVARIAEADNCIINLSGRLYDQKPVKLTRYDQQIWTTSLKPLAENLFMSRLDVANAGKADLLRCAT